MPLPGYGVEGKDLGLSFSWRGVTVDHLRALGLPVGGHKNLITARQGLAACLLLGSESGQWVSYSRDKDHYPERKRYWGPAYTWSNVTHAVEEFCAANLITEDRAHPCRWGWRSRVFPLPAFFEKLGPPPVLVDDPFELVQLKSGDRLINYPETPQIVRWRDELREVNEAFAFAGVDVVGGPFERRGRFLRANDLVINLDKRRGYRVFNDTWLLGGRLYGPFWQSMPKTWRAGLRIDGSSTVEPDFAQLHPRLLYAMCNQVLDGDAYTVAKQDFSRAQLKVAWQIMMNSRSRKSGVAAIRYELKLELTHAQRLLKLLMDRHRAVASHFFSGIGLRLQRLDSDLMMDVVLRALRRGIVVLPVHDSFIVQAALESSVREIMDDALAIALKSAALGLAERRVRPSPFYSRERC